MWLLAARTSILASSSWLGIARELTVGTPFVPVITHPLDQATSARGHAEVPQGQGPPRRDDEPVLRDPRRRVRQFSFGGPNFLDSHGYSSTTCSGTCPRSGRAPANPATTSGVLPVGNPNMTLAAAPPAAYTAGADHPDRRRRRPPRSSSSADCRVERGDWLQRTTRCGSPTRPRRPSARAGTPVHPQVRGTQLAARLRGGVRGAAAHAHVHGRHEHRQRVHQRHLRDRADEHVRCPACTRARVLKSLDFSGNAEQLLGHQDGRRLVAVLGRRHGCHQRDHELAADPELELRRHHRRQHGELDRGLCRDRELLRLLQEADADLLDRRRHPDPVRDRPRAR